MQRQKWRRKRRKKKKKASEEADGLGRVIHPYTGEQMWLNHDQRLKFFQDLPHMSADQFPPKGARKGSMGSSSMPPIPPSGFPPHMPQHMVYGPYGTPGTPAASTLPVLSGSGSPENTVPGSFAYGGKPA